MSVRCVSVGAPRELCSNGERRSDGALYFGMPKSFSEIRDDEGYATQVPNASAKVLLFSDMAMGWFGLRAVLVRIACKCPMIGQNARQDSKKKHKE